MSDREKLKVLELYSGIGGMHFALQESGIAYEVAQAVDINPSACQVYRQNFPNTKLTEGFIEGAIDLKKLEQLKIDMVLMSPPCQPFTRMGKQRDSDDTRTTSFLYILDLISKLSEPPRYILVENVKGFESSQTRRTLLDTLEKASYTMQEFLLTPLQFGIPNCRLRYYLTAKRKPLKFTFQVQPEIMKHIPDCLSAENVAIQTACSRTCFQSLDKLDTLPKHETTETQNFMNYENDSHLNRITGNLETENRLPSITSPLKGDNQCGVSSLEDEIETESQRLRQQHDDIHKPFTNCRKVQEFLEPYSPDCFKDYLLPDSALKRFVIMDIVPASARKTSCFARRYGNFIEGGGSVLMMTENPKIVKSAALLKDRREQMKENTKDGWEEETLAVLRDLKLRWFTPREMANLLCFPHTLNFPEGLTLKQKYKCLGNSLNVKVVSSLIRMMLKGDNTT